MTSRFVIREKNTEAFCTSSRRATFGFELADAALFTSRASAERAIRQMFSNEMNPHGGNTWSVWNPLLEKDFIYHNSHYQEYIALLESYPAHRDYAERVRTTQSERRCEMEVLEVKLTLV